MLLLVPRVATSVFIYFDFEVYLHENNNNSMIDIAYILNISLRLLLVVGIIGVHEYFKQFPKRMLKFLSTTKCKITLYNINSSLINSALYYSQWCPNLPKKDLENASKAILLLSAEAQKHQSLQYRKISFSLPPPKRKGSLLPSIGCSSNCHVGISLPNNSVPNCKCKANSKSILHLG